MALNDKGSPLYVLELRRKLKACNFLHILERGQVLSDPKRQICLLIKP